MLLASLCIGFEEDCTVHEVGRELLVYTVLDLSEGLLYLDR